MLFIFLLNCHTSVVNVYSERRELVITTVGVFRLYVVESHLLHTHCCLFMYSLFEVTIKVRITDSLPISCIYLIILWTVAVFVTN